MTMNVLIFNVLLHISANLTAHELSTVEMKQKSEICSLAFMHDTSSVLTNSNMIYMKLCERRKENNYMGNKLASVSHLSFTYMVSSNIYKAASAPSETSQHQPPQ